MRSFLSSFFIVFLAMMNMDQTQGLTGIVNRVQNSSIWGQGRVTNKSSRQNSLFPVQVAMAKHVSAEESSSIPNLPLTAKSSFDAESYRQEMTDLVYQRNMQRMLNP